ASHCHLNHYFNFTGDELAQRTGHFDKWQDIEVAEAPRTQARGEGAEWLARRPGAPRAGASARLAEGREDANMKNRVGWLARGLLKHPIATRLFARRAPDQGPRDTGAAGDENDGEVMLRVSEAETPPDFPRGVAEVTQGSITADAANASELHYISCTITLLDIAGRRSWPAHADLEMAEYRPPPITPKQAVDSRGRFRPKMGLSEADRHSRLQKLGGYARAARIAGALNASGAGASWPAAQTAILLHPMAKPSGGFRNPRPIPELARLQGAARAPTRNRKDYDWAARGRSSERAAWTQALSYVATVAQDLNCAATHFDPAECFEFVARAKAWGTRLRRGFNRAILGGRRWARGVVAGSRFAPFCLEMVIFAELDGVALAFPRADARLFFDDLAVAAHGPRQFAARWHAASAQTPLRMLEQTSDMQASKGEPGKTVTMTSAPSPQTILAKRIRPLNLRMATSENHSGVAAAAGRRRLLGAFPKRAANFAARRDLIARIRQAGGPADRIVRQAKLPPPTRGAQAMGKSDTMARELHLSVAPFYSGNANERPGHQVLRAEDVDPGATANEAPLLASAQAWHEAEPQPHLIGHLQAAWKRRAPRVARAKVPRQIARGPAGAVIATARPAPGLADPN
ncbi:unnamed protein product, partial [Prorocentrum cordatum]